jgi:Na+/proline symporter
MVLLDWIIVAAFLIGVLFLGASVARRSKGSLADFFVSGRNLPWWLAGTSLLATSFSCDTPLHVTKIIRQHGLSGAWFYWTALLFAPMVPFLFARLWRRARVVTDCEFIEMRYSGRPAVVLRAFMALFRTFAIEAITMGWVVLGMAKVVAAIVDLPPTITLWEGAAVQSHVAVVALLVAFGVSYTAMSGLWGVVVTDFVEFIVALVGAIVLAVVAVKAVGGIDGLVAGLEAQRPTGGGETSFLPPGEGAGLGVGSFLVYLLVLGWAHAESDGGGPKAQRFLACKDERHALLSGVWNVAVQNVIRNWPWYIAALASLVLYPSMADHEMAYPRMINDLLPIGLRGLLVASFFAAFLSTIDAHLSLSASYFINDLYRRFLVKRRSEAHYVGASRLAVVGMALVVGIVALQMTSVLEALKFKGELMSGLGLVLLLRWYWPRVTAWSELAAMGTSVATCLALRFADLGVTRTALFLGIDPVTGDLFPARLLIIVAVSSLVTIVVTLLVAPADKAHVEAFFAKVRPAGTRFGLVPGAKPEPFLPHLLDWGLASLFVTCSMFFVGKLILGTWLEAGLLAAGAALSGGVLMRRLRGPEAAGGAPPGGAGPEPVAEQICVAGGAPPVGAGPCACPSPQDGGARGEKRP